MKKGEYVLFGWAMYEASGGLDDVCGWFDSINAALEFFKHSDHCEQMDYYQIIDTETWEIVEEKTHGA